MSCPVIWADDAPIDSTTPYPFYNLAVNLSDVASQVVGLAAGTAGLPGFSRLVRTSAPALFDASNKTTPTNQTALLALARKVAADFYSWRCLSYDAALAGVCAWAQDGVAEVEWTYRRGGIRTRARAWPLGDEPEELQHVDRFDPTLPGTFYWAVTDAGGVAAATSADQASSGMVTVQKENAAGTFSTLLDPAGNPVRARAWNRIVSGGVAGAARVGITKDSPTGKFFITFLPC